MRYWFFEVEPQGHVSYTAEFLQLLVQSFRQYSQRYHIQHQPNDLRMQPSTSKGTFLSVLHHFTSYIVSIIWHAAVKRTW